VNRTPAFLDLAYVVYSLSQFIWALGQRSSRFGGRQPDQLTLQDNSLHLPGRAGQAELTNLVRVFVCVWRMCHSVNMCVA